MALTPPPFGTAPQSGQVQVKHETFDMDTFMVGIGKVIVDNMVRYAGPRHQDPSGGPYPSLANPNPRPEGCHFCGGANCHIAMCPVVEEYRHNGKCIQSILSYSCMTWF